MSPTEEHDGLTDHTLLLQNNSFTFVRAVLHHYCPQKKLREGNAFTPLCRFVHRGCTPLDAPPPEVCTSPEVCHPLLEVCAPQGWGQLAGGKQPTGMHTCSILFTPSVHVLDWLK